MEKKNKKCYCCKIKKNKIDFHKDKTRIDGLSYLCKKCTSEKAQKRWKNKTREEIKKKLEYNKIYQNTKEYKEYSRVYHQKYMSNRLKTDTAFKLQHIIRDRIRKALKNNYKVSSSVKLLGCTIKELKQYIEQRFTDNMSWDNYGEWHIDHIIPCSSFNLNNLEQQYKCFNYTNLQPLWAIDNIKKSNLMTE